MGEVLSERLPGFRGVEASNPAAKGIAIFAVYYPHYGMENEQRTKLRLE